MSITLSRRTSLILNFTCLGNIANTVRSGELISRDKRPKKKLKTIGSPASPNANASDASGSSPSRACRQATVDDDIHYLLLIWEKVSTKILKHINNRFEILHYFTVFRYSGHYSKFSQAAICIWLQLVNMEHSQPQVVQNVPSLVLFSFCESAGQQCV